MKTRCINPYKLKQYYHHAVNVRRMQTIPKQYTPKNNEMPIEIVNGAKYNLELFTQLSRRFLEIEIEAYEAIYKIKFSPENREKLIEQML